MEWILIQFLYHSFWNKLVPLHGTQNYKNFGQKSNPDLLCPLFSPRSLSPKCSFHRGREVFSVALCIRNHNSSCSLHLPVLHPIISLCSISSSSLENQHLFLFFIRFDFAAMLTYPFLNKLFTTRNVDLSIACKAF